MPPTTVPVASRFISHVGSAFAEFNKFSNAAKLIYGGKISRPSNVPLQPRWLIAALAAVGCKRLLCSRAD